MINWLCTSEVIPLTDEAAYSASRSSTSAVIVAIRVI